MHINPTQLKQVDRQVRRLISCGNFYGTKLKEAGVDGVSSEEDFLALPFSHKEDLRLAYPLGLMAVPEEELPLELPDVESYEPTGTGESPLAAIDEWVNTTCPICGAPAKRETNTMPQWAGSSWYFLRYVDNHNEQELVSKEAAHKYLPVDMYIGGVEHAVLHLLYSRFYTKFLYDIGVVDFEEPFKKLFNQGMITGKNGVKMSKSKGNVVSPDELVRDYGCDALRMYELFVGPPQLDAEWDDRGIDGVRRFLTKVWNLLLDSTKGEPVKATNEMIRARHQLIYTITSRLNDFSLNTVISGFMEYTNQLTAISKKCGGIDPETRDGNTYVYPLTRIFMAGISFRF